MSNTYLHKAIETVPSMPLLLQRDCLLAWLPSSIRGDPICSTIRTYTVLCLAVEWISEACGIISRVVSSSSWESSNLHQGHHPPLSGTLGYSYKWSHNTTDSITYLSCCREIYPWVLCKQPWQATNQKGNNQKPYKWFPESFIKSQFIHSHITPILSNILPYPLFGFSFNISCAISRAIFLHTYVESGLEKV